MPDKTPDDNTEPLQNQEPVAHPAVTPADATTEPGHSAPAMGQPTKQSSVKKKLIGAGVAGAVAVGALGFGLGYLTGDATVKPSREAVRKEAVKLIENRMGNSRMGGEGKRKWRARSGEGNQNGNGPWGGPRPQRPNLQQPNQQQPNQQQPNQPQPSGQPAPPTQAPA